MATQRTKKLHILTLLVAGLLFGTGLNAQGWSFQGQIGWPSNWPGVANGDGNYITGVYQFNDGDYGGTMNMVEDNAEYAFVWVDQNSVSQHFSSCIAFNSEESAYNHFSRSSLVLSNDDILVLEEKIRVTGGDRDLYLSLYQTADTSIPFPILWHKPVYNVNDHKAFARSVIQTADGGFIILGSVQELPANSLQNVLLIKTDAAGVPSWSKIYDTPDHDFGAHITAATDGGYYILKTLRPESDTFRTEAHLLKVDATGTQQWEVNLTGTGNDQPSDMVATQDGGLAITGMNIASGRDVFLLKTDASGAVLWRRDYIMPNRGTEGRSVVEDQNGDLVIVANRIDSTTLKKDILLMKSDATGLPLWERKFASSSKAYTVYDLSNTADGGYLFGGSAASGFSSSGIMIKTDVNGIVTAGRITGNVMRDLDVDCSVTAGDTPLENWVVKAIRDSTRLYIGTTDHLGNYSIACDTGDYVVSLIYPAPYWNACAQDVAIHVGYQDTIQVDFSVEPTADCPFMTVEHSSSYVRPCDTTTFTVHYCNHGPTAAVNASFEVELDGIFTFLYGDTPPSAQNGNVLTFPLGDVDPNQCGDFQFAALVDCLAPMWYTACSEVHIFPDSLCTPPNPEWSGAVIELDNACEGDSVHFILRNAGEQDMPEALDYIIIEDAVLLMDGDFQLESMEMQDIAVPANGSTYHLIAEQEPFAPGGPLQLTFVEGCNTNPSGGSTGFANQYPENDGDPFFSMYCPVVTTSYDPNDKQAIPTGFGPEHFIYQNTDLEYTIRFQNTGNDTAFRVVLIDTLSGFLDPASIQPGASSHPYEYSIEGAGMLRFVFQNILLPDSTTNPDGSQGFVTFRIRQKPNNTVGTVIENNADIYFDFNVPVRTNTVFHTIHEPLFDDITSTTLAEETTLEIAAYPNPFSDQLRIKLNGSVIPNTTFHLYRSTGQLVRTLELNDNQALLQREGLDAGFYFFTVQAGAKLLGTGKVVVK